MPDFELQADFDHDGRLTGSESEHDARQTEPGALLVANADADQRAFPTAVTAGPAVALDFTRYTPSAADDEIQPLTIAVNNAAAAAGRTFGVRVPGIHGVRVRFYDSTGRILPVFTSDTPGEHPIPTPAAPSLALQIETRSYPGSPYGHAMLFDTTYEPASDQVEESRFELELFSRDAQQNEVVHDSGQFSVVPILLLDNGLTATRLYISDKPDNAATVTDLRDALRGLPGLQLITVSPSITEDTWLQDQFQPGIAVGGDRWRHVIVHLPRIRSDFVARQGTVNLAGFVTSHFPAHDVGLLDDFWSRTISFSDTSNTVRTLSFVDCAGLAIRMFQVFPVIEYLNETGSQADPNFEQQGWLDWTEARAHVNELLESVSRTVTQAEGRVSSDASRMLRAKVTVAGQRVQQITGAFPMSGQGATFTLTSGGLSFDVAADTVRELFRRIHQLEASANYGGNIEPGPPTANAPLGKIVLGNVRMEFEDAEQNQIEIDHVDPDVQRLLHKQKQPVVEVDTGWLDVGHVDEVLTFVPDRNGTQPSAALRASSGLAMAIVDAAAARFQDGLPQNHPQRSYTHPSGVMQRLTSAGSAPVTRLMRGKLWMQSHPRPTAEVPVPPIVDPPRMYQDLAFALNGIDPATGSENPYTVNIHDIHYRPGEGPERAYPADITVLELQWTDLDNRSQSVNAYVEETYLTPIDSIVAYEFPGVRMFPLPVVFDRVVNTRRWSAYPWSFSTSAFTPDLVNMQALNGHLLVPRPYGPRMAPADATAVLQAVLNDYSWGRQLAGQLTPSFYRRTGLDTTTCWIIKQDAVTFTASEHDPIDHLFDGIKNLDDVANCFIDGFPGQTTQEVGRLILRDNPRNFDPTGALRDGWRRFVIREGTVDLFEAYVQLVASTLGQTLHFVDSWFYHVRFGGVHCATNVIREPRPGQIPAWWTV